MSVMWSVCETATPTGMCLAGTYDPAKNSIEMVGSLPAHITVKETELLVPTQAGSTVSYKRLDTVELQACNFSNIEHMFS